MPKHIASDREWSLAKNLLAQQNHKTSGFKLNRKDIPELAHSFVYFTNDSGDKSTVVSLALHYNLGAGAFGRAVVAEDEQGILYALKIQKDVTLPANEKQCLEKMGYLEFCGQRGNTHYVLQRYFDGITLEEYLNLNQAMSEAQKFGLLRLIIAAIQEVHDKNIIHGDIKPDNLIVYVNESGSLQIKAIDFGASRILNAKEKSLKIAHIIGAPRYRAPEAGQGKRCTSGTISKESDIYALGILASEDLHLNTEFIKNMCAQYANNRITTQQALASITTFAPPPQIERSKRLILKYQYAMQQAKKKEKDHIEQRLANICRHQDILLIKLAATQEIIVIPSSLLPKKKQRYNYGEYIIYNNGIAYIMSPSEFVDEKYHAYSLPQLLAIPGHQIQHRKNELLAAIRKIVRLTNSIEELYELFNHLKQVEYKTPLLRQEQGRFMKMFGAAGMTTSWEEAINIFKERAMELAKNAVSLNTVVDNPDKYATIFQETRARIFKSKSHRLREYEQLQHIAHTP